ncbi:MAG: ABC transporter ATP-binding protein [Actinomycetes bacterium]
MRTSTGQPAAISVTGLTKTYDGNVEAVRGIDFEVAPGEVFGLLGPNGAGKSTTIGMLTTTVRPTAGRAILAGFDVEREPLAARRVSSVVFQDTVVDRGLSGHKNLQLHARLWNVAPAHAATLIGDLAEAFGLGDVLDRAVETYSGGQRRRLEIARALVSSPRVLFLDEPTVGLDTRIRYELLDLISGLRQHSTTTVLTTHYLDEAERLCDRIAIVHAGQIVAMGTPTALLAQLGTEILELRVTGDPQAAVAALRSRAVAGEDAFTVGATLTIPLHKVTARRHGCRDRPRAVHDSHHHPPTHSRRRLPAPHRRPTRSLKEKHDDRHRHRQHHHIHPPPGPTGVDPGAARPRHPCPAPADAQRAHPA